ncbi:MAG TPA: beta-propeller fold lactonase family protein [Steroidobacter sp.]|nr:beta-propeller fold lactonase family protein [Steroidobacter sp.]
MSNVKPRFTHLLFARVLLALLPIATSARAADNYQIYVSNERSGDVTVIDGASLEAVATFPVGKRPRGIHASPDGKTVYVALSGTPIEGPPQLDARGNPVFERDKDDDDDDDDADKAADGVGVVDVATRKLVKKISVGSDPEEFDISQDGRRLYVSNEDVKTASAVDIANGKVESIVPLTQEPEGVAVTPDGKTLIVTCETGGDVFFIDIATFKVKGNIKVGPRPRSVAFLEGGKLAVVPSESNGNLYVIDTAQIKVVRTAALPKGSRPMRLRASADGSKLYVSTGRGGTVAVVDTKSFAVLDNIAVGKRPWGIVLSPDGKYLFSANGPSNDVSVIDLTTNREIAKVKAGDSPWGLAVVKTSK